MSKESLANTELTNVVISNVLTIVRIDMYCDEENWSKKVRFPQPCVLEKCFHQGSIHVRMQKYVQFSEVVVGWLLETNDTGIEVRRPESTMSKLIEK